MLPIESCSPSVRCDHMEAGCVMSNQLSGFAPGLSICATINSIISCVYGLEDENAKEKFDGICRIAKYKGQYPDEQEQNGPLDDAMRFVTDEQVIAE